MLTNQSADLETFLFPKRTNISMSHGKTQLMFVFWFECGIHRNPTIHKFTTKYTIPTWDCQVHHWCFYINSRSEYFGICTTWWNNNNGLKVNSHTNLEIIGPKIPSPWIIRQMLNETSMYSHDSVKVIQYCMLRPHCFLFFPSNVNTKPLRCAVCKGKWALDPRPTCS